MANPNPSPETRFKAGVPTNPAGKTSAQRKREIANAERATRLRGRLLAALEAQLDKALEESADGLDLAAVEAIQSDVLKLLKDSEDRGLGAPLSKAEHTGKDGSPLAPTIIRIVAAKHDISDDQSTAEIS